MHLRWHPRVNAFRYGMRLELLLAASQGDQWLRVSQQLTPMTLKPDYDRGESYSDLDSPVLCQQPREKGAHCKRLPR